MLEENQIESQTPNNIVPDNDILEKDGGDKKNYRKYLSVIWEFLKIVIIAIIIVVPIRYFIFQPFIVKGESMVPNYQPGDYLIVDEISYKINDINRGDVVVLKYPLDYSQRFIKRVIGLPGETVEIKNGKIMISSDEKTLTLIEDEYLPINLRTEGNLKIELQNNEYYVLGDNRQFSYDSRRWGALPKEDIIGRVIFRLFPLNSITYISKPSY